MEDVSAIIILFLLLWVFKPRERRTSQLLSYLFYCFGWSNQEKVKDASNIIILFLMLWVLKWRESEGRLNDCHTFLLLSVLKIRENGEHLSSYYTFSNAFWSSSQEKIEGVSTILILFLLLLVFKSRESEGRLSYSHSFPFASGTQVKRKWTTSHL